LVFVENEFRLGQLMFTSPLIHALLAASALGMACALLSVFVVCRRWAFIGEGISHAGLGGAGLTWLLMLVFPGLDLPWVPYLGVVVFCIGTAVGIGWLSRHGKVEADTAIGVFLVASLAFGILAQQIYLHVSLKSPPAWDTLFFGQLKQLSGEYAMAAICVSAAVVVVIGALFKELLAYSFDPMLAEVSGVRAGAMHYLLMILLAITIVLGVRVAGSVLVTAMLVLPGATAMLLSRDLRTVFTLAVVFGVLGAVAGILLNTQYSFLPAGPGIVLTLFVLFLGAYAVGRVKRV